MRWYLTKILTQLHTTFQQNKDCNFEYLPLAWQMPAQVAYDLPAKQGLQLPL